MVIEFKKIWPLGLMLTAFNLVVWSWILPPQAVAAPELYFLDVGQGDSQLIILPSSPAETGSGGQWPSFLRRRADVQILIDGGPDASLLANLDKILQTSDHYLDLILETHPQQDHFGGFIELLRDYEIGLYLHNGRVNNTNSHEELRAALQKNGAPKIILAAGDKIKYQGAVLKIISPETGDKNQDFNATCLVVMFHWGKFKTLYTCDIGASTEKELAQKYNLAAQVLKVPHHGSKKSSSAEFLDEVRPRITVIGVGRNPYGHPTKEALSRLTKAGAKIYRTDKNGLVKLSLDRDRPNVRVYTEH